MMCLVISEFDIVFPKSTNGTVVAYLPTGTENFTEFTLVLWFTTNNASTQDLKIELVDTNDTVVVAFDLFRKIMFRHK